MDYLGISIVTSSWHAQKVSNPPGNIWEPMKKRNVENILETLYSRMDRMSTQRVHCWGRRAAEEYNYRCFHHDTPTNYTQGCGIRWDHYSFLWEEKTFKIWGLMVQEEQVTELLRCWFLKYVSEYAWNISLKHTILLLMVIFISVAVLFFQITVTEIYNY